MNSGSFASSYVETVRLPDSTSHNFRTLSVRNPRNSVTKYPLFLRNTLTPVPRNNAARYNSTMFKILFHYPRVLARHCQGPSAQARERYLTHCADQGAALDSLLGT